jgi:hypothetical protein
VGVTFCGSRWLADVTRWPMSGCDGKGDRSAGAGWSGVAGLMCT